LLEDSCPKGAYFRTNCIRKPHSSIGGMIPGPEATVARATTLVALIKAKAVHASRLLVNVLLHYGIDAARKMADLFARMSHRTLLRLRPAYRCLQRPQDLQHQVGAPPVLLANNCHAIYTGMPTILLRAATGEGAAGEVDSCPCSGTEWPDTQADCQEFSDGRCPEELHHSRHCRRGHGAVSPRSWRPILVSQDDPTCVLAQTLSIIATPLAQCTLCSIHPCCRRPLCTLCLQAWLLRVWITTQDPAWSQEASTSQAAKLQVLVASG